MEKSTARQYERAWRSWSGWCDSWHISCFSTSIKNILTNLARLFHEKGLQYRIINVYRSAISAFHIPIDGMVIGKHPLVSKFMKGVFRLSPPESKYFVTWDVNQVLNLLKSWSPADSITLKQLTLKLFMLAALISAARKSSLDKFDPRFRFFKSNGVLFKVPGLTKCANQKKPIESFFLASFPPDRKLCFSTYLRIYERKTKVFRPTSARGKNLLFLSYIKPHKPVSSSTLARWAKSVVSLAGIDTKIFKPHSTGSQASSAAFNAGVALSDILEAADWTNESTFTRFYKKAIVNDNQGVLSEHVHCSDSSKSGCSLAWNSAEVMVNHMDNRQFSIGQGFLPEVQLKLSIIHESHYFPTRMWHSFLFQFII